MKTKEELFKKYSINETHKKWEAKDSLMSVELYRIMHGGSLPPEDDKTVDWVTDFLDAFNQSVKFRNKIMQRLDWGSLYLTAKRMTYMLSEEILKTLNYKSEE